MPPCSITLGSGQLRTIGLWIESSSASEAVTSSSSPSMSSPSASPLQPARRSDAINHQAFFISFLPQVDLRGHEAVIGAERGAHVRVAEDAVGLLVAGVVVPEDVVQAQRRLRLEERRLVRTIVLELFLHHAIGRGAE